MLTCFSFALLIPKQFDVPIYVKPFQFAQAVNKPGLIQNHYFFGALLATIIIIIIIAVKTEDTFCAQNMYF